MSALTAEGRLGSGRRLPRLAPLAVLGAAVATAFAVLSLGSLTIQAMVALTVVIYAVAIAVVSAAVEGRRRAKDRLVTAVVYSAFGLAMLPLLWICWTVVSNGIAKFDLYFLTNSMRGVFGGMEAGGIYHAILGTLLVTGFATVISVPIGVMCAIYLVEYGRGKLARAITFFVDVMTGIPSIVAGLFAYALFALFFGPGVRMGVAGSVALSVLMIPVVVRSVEEMLKLVPNELREASYALGVPKWRTIVKVVLPTAAGGIAAGITLAIARVIGETAPLLIVLGVIDSIKYNIFEDQRIMTLPVYIFRQYSQGDAQCPETVEFACSTSINYDRAWAAALTLILIVMLLNLIARLVSRFFSPKTANR
jgi:phosphate transport system permease protein